MSLAGDSIFECPAPDCSNRFSTADGLGSHTYSKHGKTVDELRNERDNPERLSEQYEFYTCPIESCRKIFLESRPLASHIAVTQDDEHRELREKVECDEI